MKTVLNKPLSIRDQIFCITLEIQRHAESVFSYTSEKKINYRDALEAIKDLELEIALLKDKLATLEDSI